jgi:hypothetical protein
VILGEEGRKGKVAKEGRYFRERKVLLKETLA